MELNDFTINANASMAYALEVIEKNSLGVVLVVNVNGLLLGLITDGDIRRALLSNCSLEAQALDFMNSEFDKILESSSTSERDSFARSKRIDHLPIVDENGYLKDIYIRDYDRLLPPLDNKIVIMAGGKGKRLRPYTLDCPKPMIPIGDKPILEIILNKCKNQGFSKFTLCVNYLKEEIIEYFQDGNTRGIEIDYIEETEELGTAGALAFVRANTTSPIIVMNGDVLSNINLRELLAFHVQSDSLATISAKRQELAFPYGVIEVDNSHLVGFHEKPTYYHLINAGVYVLNPRILNNIKRDILIDMPTLLLTEQNLGEEISVYPFSDYWIDIGTPSSLDKARAEFDFISD